MFQCSFASLPQEMLLNPFYWEKSYAGLADYVACAKSHNVHRETVAQCYQFLEKQCQSPTPRSVKFCEESLREARRLVSLQKNNVSNRSGKSTNVFLAYVTCVKKVYAELLPCVSQLEKSCQSARSRSIKVIRLETIYARSLLKSNPAIKIIHLVRDPRGILLSRNNVNSPLTAVAAARTCQRIIKNIKDFELILRDFPNSHMLQLRYEDLASNPQQTAQVIYNHMNMVGATADEYFTAWWKQITNPYKNEGNFHTYRANISAEAYDWMSNLNSRDRILIENVPSCNDAIKLLNYPDKLRSSN